MGELVPLPLPLPPLEEGDSPGEKENIAESEGERVPLPPVGVGGEDIVECPKGVRVPPPPGRGGVNVGIREKVKRTERVGEKGEGEAVDVAPPLNISDPVGLKEGKGEGVERRRALGVEVAPP